ncbi:MAG: DUF4304 domain-containing protein [Actinomycetota bacterium]
MSDARKQVDQALRDLISTELRPVGFTGSLPDVRRVGEDRVDVLRVEHSRFGGQFRAVIAARAIDDLVARQINPVKARMLDMRSRTVLGSCSAYADHWFVYDPQYWRPEGDSGFSEGRCNALILRFAALLEAQAKPYWESGGTNAVRWRTCAADCSMFGHQTTAEFALAPEDINRFTPEEFSDIVRRADAYWGDTTNRQCPGPTRMSC